MGGDRDGNPFVTPEATREVVLTARLAAITEYEIAVQKLMYELSAWRSNAELKVHVPQEPLTQGSAVLPGPCITAYCMLHAVGSEACRYM